MGEELLIFKILKMCGLTDMEEINRVIITVTADHFNVTINRNARTPDGKLVVQDKALVEITEKFELIQIQP